MSRVYVQPGRGGQLQVALPGVARGRYATGQQEPCAPCAAVGRSQQGVSRDGEGSTPLCQSCWLAREQRRARAEQAEQDRLVWEQLGELATVAELEEACGACGERDASPSCWLCGYAWLREVQAGFEADQAAAVAAEQAQFEQIAAVSEAEARVAELTAWVERLQQTVRAYEAGYGGRAVELLADLLARLEVEAAGRASRRGRPSVTRYVGAVLAVDADWRSGRRAMPGRERTAWLLDCSDRAIYGAWRQVAALGWAERTRVGGRNSLQRRLETGRPNDRAEFDVLQLHRSQVPTAARATFLPAALALLGELMQRAVTVLEREQEALDGLRARAGGWTDWPEQVRRTQLRAAVNRTREAVTDGIPAAVLTTNICRSHPVSRGEHVSSCEWWGLRFSRRIMIHKCEAEVGLSAGDNGGASRPSPTTSGRLDLESGCFRRSQAARRPRTAGRPSGRSRRPIVRPWAAWAPQLARDLVELWPWVAEMPRAWLHAILGSALGEGGPDWTAARLARWVTEQHARPVLMQPAAPAAYLRTLLTEAFSGPATPPHPARRHTEHRRQVAAAAGVEQAARFAVRRAELDERDAAAAAATGTGRDQARAMLARIAAHRRTATRPAARLDTCDWPEVAQPGAGRPDRGPRPAVPTDGTGR
jgi:hypothetical protein